MTDEAEELEAVLRRFGQEVVDTHPGLSAVVQQHREGTLSAEDAVKEIWKVLARDSSADDRLAGAMFKSFGIEVRDTDIAKFPDREKMLERWGFSDEDLVFTPFPDRPDYKMLHPLLMGMIVELLQFDGDVPELRSGKLPEGGSPAVPVDTRSRDPLMVGAMLKSASAEVAKELEDAQQAHELRVKGMTAAIGAVEHSDARLHGLMRQENERGAGVPGYVPGRRAEMRVVDSPQASELRSLPFRDQQALAHKALTSTQGRRTVVPIITEMILNELRARGHEEFYVGRGAAERILDEVDWTIGIDGSTAERNPRFNFIDVAARSLTAKIIRHVCGRDGQKIAIDVSPVNTVAERRVGWRVVLFSSD